MAPGPGPIRHSSGSVPSVGSVAVGEGTTERFRASGMTAKKVVARYPAAPAPTDGLSAASVDELSAPLDDALIGPVLDTLPIEEFNALIAKGRLAGGLTQDDVVGVLRSVELSADLITGVVERIQAAGIEFTYDSGETTIVPMAPLDGSVETVPLLVAVPVVADRVTKAPAKRSRPSRAAGSTGFSESDSFRGSAADPVHIYLKEIGKVKLLDAALEVELAERILAGTEAEARLVE